MNVWRAPPTGAPFFCSWKEETFGRDRVSLPRHRLDGSFVVRVSIRGIPFALNDDTGHPQCLAGDDQILPRTEPSPIEQVIDVDR